MGFQQNWIVKVMNCVKSASYYFRINKEVAGPIIPSRGLRQGDLLSPYLFVLGAHGLSSLFNTFESRGLFRGVKIAPTSPSVSHLFFADDSLVFCRATMEEGARVKDCLSLYEKASGQIINYDKSALLFSPNTHMLLMVTIKNNFTILAVQQHDLYLGLPTVSLRSKRLQFKYLVDRVVQRIQGWGNKWFSTGGKEVLIKSILQAVPTFAMSCFKLPLLVCDDIESECANFWWAVENGRRKMHRQTWDALCQPKGRGGLGFRKLVEFNKALLAKQLWCLIRNPESLVGRVLKGRYFRHGSVLKAGLGSNPSYIWRSLVWSKYLLQKGILWRVGDGKSIKIFEEKWIPSMDSIMDPPLVPWDRADTIPIPAANVCDSLFWRYDTKARAKEKIREATPRNKSEKVWKPPVSCTLKLNVDAAVNEDRHQFGIGGAVRYNQGRLMLAFGKQINQPISVVHGELLEIRENIILLYDRCFSDVQVATDSQLAVLAVTTNEDDLGYNGICAVDIRERLKTPVISEIIHVRSSANKVAHNLAHFSFLLLHLLFG
ncbi:uncharacterized protein [Primulina eburnea]|uniref:uncharacterized protein n=1 Tax=Primulina eburnea TaxID=1245227 RepID=UPI003C6C074C